MPLTKQPAFESSESNSVSIWSAAELMKWLPSLLCQGHLVLARSPAAEIEVTGSGDTELHLNRLGEASARYCSWGSVSQDIDLDIISVICTCQQQLNVFHGLLDKTPTDFLKITIIICFQVGANLL